MKILRWSVERTSQRVNESRIFCRRLVARCGRTLTQQDGIAIVLALVSIMLLSMLGLYGAVGSQTDLRIAGNDQLSKRTWDVADGGVRHSFRILGQDTANAWSNGFSDELANGGVGGSLGSAGGTIKTIEGNQYVFFPFGGSNATDGYYVRAEDNFDDGDQTTDMDQRVRIIARGQVGNAVKIIEALTVPPVKCALTANGETLLSGNSMSSNVQVNTLDGNGACVHTNDDLRIQGSVNFPDGASTSQQLEACNGNPTIGITGGSCNAVEVGAPKQPVPTINPAQWAQYVANLGIANPYGPYYILNTRGTNAGKITKGGNCKVTDPETVESFDPAQPSKCTPDNTACGTAAASTQLGECKEGVEVKDGDAFWNAEYDSIAGGGGGQGTITLDQPNKKCKVKDLKAGIYYCDGMFDLIGPISGDVTLIARDNIEMASQSSFTAYFPKTSATNAILATVTLTNAIANPAINTKGALAGLMNIDKYKETMGMPTAPTDVAALYPLNADLTNLGKQANTMLSYFSMISGKDIKMTGGTQVSVIGIIFAHDEIYLSGNKNITGYIMAGSSKPTFPGDPYPPGPAASGPGDGIEIDTLSGNVVLNYRPFATQFPLGAPKMIAWHDNMPKN